MTFILYYSIYSRHAQINKERYSLKCLIFQRFYSIPYYLVNGINTSKTEAFFTTTEILQFSLDQKIDAPIIKTEARAMKTGTSPGLDGFSIEYIRNNMS